MIKVGFIDYFLDEWHANNYPSMFRKWAGELEVACAWAKIDSPRAGGLTTEEWGKKYGIRIAASMEALIEECDALIVLSPDNPEMHEELCRLPLASGKRTYVDKTFAVDSATADRIMKMAEDGHTPWYTTSSLVFADEYKALREKPVAYIDSCGPGKVDNYSVHQLEPIVSILNAAPLRAINMGNEKFPVFMIEFEGGKYAKVAMFEADGEFMITAGFEDGTSKAVKAQSDFWKSFTIALGKFFADGTIPVSHEATRRVMRARELCLMAQDKPFEWVR